MGRWWDLLICLGLGALAAPAQEPTASLISSPGSVVYSTHASARPGAIPDGARLRALPSWFDAFSEVSQKVRAEYNRHPLQKYHYVHNERFHPLVFHFVTGLYADRSYLFRHWYSHVKGLRLLDLASGRLSIGFETRQELIFESDRRYSGPFLRPDFCYSAGMPGGSPCYALSPLRDGNRLYGVSLRLHLSREQGWSFW